MNSTTLDISHILTQLLKKNHMTETELAKKTDLPRATVNRLVSGRTPDPRASTLAAIAKYFNISIEELLGKKTMPLPTSKTSAKHSRVPLISWGAADCWRETNTESLKEVEWIPINEATEMAKFALRLSGDAMTPMFEENTLLLVDPNKATRNRDYIVVKKFQTGEILFRQLIIDNSYKLLKPINMFFPVLKLEINDQIIGIVIEARNTF